MRGGEESAIVAYTYELRNRLNGVTEIGDLGCRSKDETDRSSTSAEGRREHFIIGNETSEICRVSVQVTCWKDTNIDPALYSLLSTLKSLTVGCLCRSLVPVCGDKAPACPPKRQSRAEIGVSSSQLRGYTRGFANSMEVTIENGATPSSPSQENEDTPDPEIDGAGPGGKPRTHGRRTHDPQGIWGAEAPRPNPTRQSDV